MRAILVVLVLALGAAPPRSVGAEMLFSFDWTASATFSTLVPVNRTEPDGSITPYDQTTISRMQSGSGVLTLTLPSAPGGAYVFEFSGAGGSGAGQADASGVIRPGEFAFPLPPDVPVAGSRPFVGGRVELLGDPAQPSGFSISYYDTASPHCVVQCTSIEFQGTGTVISAAESSPVVLLALSLVIALVAGQRARRAALGPRTAAVPPPAS